MPREQKGKNKRGRTETQQKDATHHYLRHRQTKGSRRRSRFPRLQVNLSQNSPRGDVYVPGILRHDCEVSAHGRPFLRGEILHSGIEVSLYLSSHTQTCRADLGIALHNAPYLNVRPCGKEILPHRRALLDDNRSTPCKQALFSLTGDADHTSDADDPVCDRTCHVDLPPGNDEKPVDRPPHVHHSPCDERIPIDRPVNVDLGAPRKIPSVVHVT